MTCSSILTVGHTDTDYVAFLEGRATMSESPAFHAFVTQALDNAHEPTFVLDLDDCEYMDSTFLGCLISLHKRYSQQPPERFLVAAQPQTRTRLLATARLDLILKLIEAAPDCGEDRTRIPTPPVESTEFAQHALRCHQLLADIGGPQAAVFQLVADQLARDIEQNL